MGLIRQRRTRRRQWAENWVLAGTGLRRSHVAASWFGIGSSGEGLLVARSEQNRGPTWLRPGRFIDVQKGMMIATADGTGAERLALPPGVERGDADVASIFLIHQGPSIWDG